MTEWKEAIWMAFSAMMAAMIISLVATLGAFSRQAAFIQAESENAIAIMKEYRKFSQFDETTLYPQDVISAVASSRGNPSIWVDSDEGPGVNFSWKWEESTPPEQFTVEYLTSLFPLGGYYFSSIVKDLNGAIVRIEFRRN